MSNLADLVHNISYEVMPFRRTEQAVLDVVPTEVPLTVTVTEAKGLDTTVDFSVRLRGHGYTVAPHLAARQFVDANHVEDVVGRLRAAGIDSVFVIGGDAPRPAGEYQDAFSLLRQLQAMGSPFAEVGIGGYPEGHATIGGEAIDLALIQKAPLATRAITQMCFNAKTTRAWAADLASAGIGLPVYVGMPGPVNRQKLVRISAGLGLGQSARFLRKQGHLMWRLLLPSGYRPTKLVKRLAAGSPGLGNIRGLHIFTFNELRQTEQWRQSLLATVPERPALFEEEPAPEQPVPEESAPEETART